MDNIKELVILLVTAAALGSLLAFAATRFKSKRPPSNRKENFKDLMLRLEAAKNKLGAAIELKEVSLSHVERAAKMFEQLLILLNQLKAEGRLDPLSINTASFVAQEIESLLLTAVSQFEGETHHCYFCSRPYTGHKALAKVKQGGTESEVTTCQVCLNKIRAGGRAKVLHFTDDFGSPVHWSKYKDFLPNSSYWNINIDTNVQKKPDVHLALVKDDHLNT